MTNDFASAFHTAIALIGRFDSALREIVLLSLQVSLTASACAFAIGAPWASPWRSIALLAAAPWWCWPTRCSACRRW